MKLDDDSLLGTKIRHLLDRDCEMLEPRVAMRLQEIRQHAISHQRAASGRLGLAGFGRLTSEVLLPQVRTVAAITALMLGMVGTYYWNTYEDADDYAEIDSALLADDLPVAAYTDQGFHEWVEHSSQSQ